jgi:hypothetical protein
MPDDFISIKVENLDKLLEAIQKFPRQAARYLAAAGKEASSHVILPTEGLKKYPPKTAANAPPTPYYIRGRGTQYKSKNTDSSESLGTQFYTESHEYYTTIGNQASYAKYVVGEQQAHFMAPKGWRKLKEVAEEKITDITKVYQACVDKLLRDIGLK